MTEKLSTTAERLKGLRIEANLTPAVMAKATDVTEAEYLAIEAGKSDPSFTFLFKCATKFGVDLSQLVTGADPHLRSYTVSRAGEGMDIRRKEGFDYLHLAPLLRNRLAEPFMVTAKYSKALEHGAIALTSHGGQEFNYIIEGTLKVQIEDKIEIAHAGDSLLYDASKRHGMVAAGGKDCKFLSLVIPNGQGEDDQHGAPDFDHRATPAPDHRLYKQFVNETTDENGRLQRISFNIPDDFNFGYDCVDAIAKKKPDKLAMLWVSPVTHEERRFTFADMKKYTDKTANYFKSLGITKGDKVMLVLRRHYQFWFAIVALHKIGAVAIPATDQLLTKDFVYRFNAAGVKALVCTAYGEASKSAEAALSQSPTVKILSIANGEREGWSSFDKGVEAASEKLERVHTLKHEHMLMYFTSGTTGYPKIAAHNYTYPLGHITTAVWWHNVKEDGLHFTIADTGWGKAVWGKLYGQWLAEAAVFTVDFERLSPIEILPMFKKYGITTFCAPPTIYRFFIKEDLSKFDLTSLKYATTAGEALNSEVYEQFYRATKLKLMEGFGQTETTVAICNTLGMNPKPGSMGKPIPQYDICLMSGDGTPAKSGEVGEICIGTRFGAPTGMFCEYYLNPEKTAEVWHDGFYHTGDMAWEDEDGYFWYVGRTDDLIKSSGYRIGPFEIESVLMEMPCVLECAVTGVPDTEGERGQLVKATIVLAKGHKPSDALVKEIQNYVKTHTAPYKYPRVVEFVDSLPKTISGKIRRVEIREGK